ncbi:MAG: hypothetical protein AAGN46_05500, partial [Acidobacteriota bacterium]
LRRALDARDAAAAIEPGGLGPAWKALQAEAWGILASAQRVVGDLRRAENAINVAVAFLDPPAPVDPTLRPRLAQRAAYVRLDQQRIDEALDLATLAFDTFCALDRRDLAVGARVDRALALRRGGDPHAAEQELETALNELDALGGAAAAEDEREEAARLRLAIAHNLAYCRFAVASTPAQWRRALSALDRARAAHAAHDRPLHRAKLDMLHATARLRLGEVDGAVAELERVRRRFAELSATTDEAAVLLQLAEIEATRGRIPAVRRAAGQLFPLLRRLDLDDAARDALHLFLGTVPERQAADRARQARDALAGRGPIEAGSG